jgi:hypothetical protein
MMLMRLSLISLLSLTYVLHHIHRYTPARRLKCALLMEASTNPSTRERFAQSVAFVKLGRTAVD